MLIAELAGRETVEFDDTRFNTLQGGSGALAEQTVCLGERPCQARLSLHAVLPHVLACLN